MKQFHIAEIVTDTTIRELGLATIGRVIARRYAGISTQTYSYRVTPGLSRVVVSFWSTPERVLRQELRQYQGTEAFPEM